MTGYFDYLCREVDIGGPGGRPYRRLAGWLYRYPFRSKLPGDLNREADGVALRRGYSDVPGKCSVLEVLVAMSRQLEYMSDGLIPQKYNGSEEWFMRMIENLGLVSLDDDRWDVEPDECEEIAECNIDVFLNRAYAYDGTDGVFPLRDPTTDQATVELWYQMNAYLMEQIGNF